jgi:hypothetical protein
MEVNFKQKVNDKDFKSAGVILGLHKKEIIRNSMNPSANYDTLYTYYYSNGYSKQLDEVRNAEKMVQNAIDEALAKYKAEHNDSTPEEVAETEPWKFPKASDFAITDNHPKVSFGANPPDESYIGMTAEELSKKLKEVDKERENG